MNHKSTLTNWRGAEGRPEHINSWKDEEPQVSKMSSRCTTHLATPRINTDRSEKQTEKREGTQ